MANCVIIDSLALKLEWSGFDQDTIQTLSRLTNATDVIFHDNQINGALDSWGANILYNESETGLSLQPKTAINNCDINTESLDNKIQTADTPKCEREKTSWKR